MEKTEEEYNNEFDKINIMFPNAQFTIVIDMVDMDELITSNQYLIIKHSYDCYCYADCNKSTEYYYIKGEHITQKYVIKQLIHQGIDLDCNHCFLEGFYKTLGSDCQFELCVGS